MSSDALDQLRRLLPIAGPGGEDIDWDEVEHAWGTRFPRDFREFMAVYGRGTVDDMLVVATPVDGDSIPGVLRCRDLTPLSVTECLFEEGADWREELLPSWPEPGGLIGWGTTGTGIDLFWRAEHDPDSWSVLVRDHRGGDAAELSMGMVEFLTRMLGRRDERPWELRDVAGYPHSRFVHADEEHLRKSRGENPWAYLKDLDWDVEEH